jgi:hypothetical protein
MLLASEYGWVFALCSQHQPRAGHQFAEHRPRYRPKGEGATWRIVRCAERNSAREIFHLSLSLLESPPPPYKARSTSSTSSTDKRVSCLSHPLLQPHQSSHRIPGLIRAPSTNSRSPSAARDREGARDPQSRLCLLTSPKTAHQPYNNPPRGHRANSSIASIRSLLDTESPSTDQQHHLGALRRSLSTSRPRRIVGRDTRKR